MTTHGCTSPAPNDPDISAPRHRHLSTTHTHALLGLRKYRGPGGHCYNSDPLRFSAAPSLDWLCSSQMSPLVIYNRALVLV